MQHAGFLHLPSTAAVLEANILKQILRVNVVNVHFGLREGKPCWAKELLAGLHFVDLDRDWVSLLELKPIESPKAAKFIKCILAFDLGPTSRQHHTYYGSLMHTGGSNELTAAPAYIKRETRLCLHSGQPQP